MKETKIDSIDKKEPCNCGCKGDKSKYAANTPASPAFNNRVEEGTKVLLEKAKSVQREGRKPLNLSVPRLGRSFTPAAEAPRSLHQSRLTNLVSILQSSYFDPESGTFPSAIDWTSTVIATHLYNYSQETLDHRYFSHLVSFYHKQNVTGLLRQNYDDQLWVVLTYLRGAAYAANREPEWVDPFLQRASVFYDIARAGWDDQTCGGGMVWGRWARYKNAITTELWIAASVGMFEVFGEERMLESAVRGWVWLKESGMFNEEGLVNDGLDGDCLNNRQMTWTYNQGVILSGLAGLYKYTGDEKLISRAQHLVDSVLTSYLVPNDNGILVESCDPFRTCDQDQWMFKGIFLQHLGYFLQDMSSFEEISVQSRKSLLEKYLPFIEANACAVWDIAKQKDGKIGNWWDGPPKEEIRRQVSAETHVSGVAAVLCAVRATGLLQSFEKGGDNTGSDDLAGKVRGLELCREKWRR